MNEKKIILKFGLPARQLKQSKLFEMHHEEIARRVVHAAFAVHKALGPGLLESVYEHCMEEELASIGLSVVRQVPIPLIYKEKNLELGFRADLIVQKKVLVELKSVETILPVHLAQIITYLKLTGIPLGFLINFNVATIKDGIRRVVHNYHP